MNRSNVAGARATWSRDIPSEVRFWEHWIASKGLAWPEDYIRRLDPDCPLQERPAALLPPGEEPHILDVGAGPLTVLGKTAPGKRLRITAVDALAYYYNRLLGAYRVTPLVRTERLEAEQLTSHFAADSFDLAYARNCLDHCYDPEQAILQMVEVVKPGCWVLLEHYANEGQHNKYDGLHHWDFDISPAGDFLIRSANGVTNMTQKHAERCVFISEMIVDGRDWLIVRARKA